MGYPLSHGYGKTLSPAFTQSKSTHISAKKSTKFPDHEHLFMTRKYISSKLMIISPYYSNYFVKSKAQMHASINLGPVAVSARHHGRSSNYIVIPNPFTSTPADEIDRGGLATLIKISAARAVGASFALACILGVFCCSSVLIGPGKANAARRRVLPRLMISSSSHNPQEEQQSSPTAQKLMTGQTVALRAFFEVMVYLASREDFPLTCQIVMKDLEVYKENAMKKIKEKKNLEAVLQEMKRKCANFMDKPEEKYNVEMAFVEILISQGKYEDALKYLDSLKRQSPPSDVRPSLYEAIIRTMSYDSKNPPDEYWKKFFDAEGLPPLGGSGPPSSS